MGAAASGCNTTLDCNMAGDCVAGRCACDVGFYGLACEALAMQSYKCGVGGLCLTNGTTTWGGSVVTADDGSHHMYAAMMTGNATLQKWLTNSVVLHAVAPAGSPQGPYEPAGVALAPRAPPAFDSLMLHNPDAKRAPDGTYLIFYDGDSAAGGGSGADPHLNQRIGLATATSPYGPWTRSLAPVLSPSAVAGAWDGGFVTNPGPYIYPNGSALLVYKAKAKAKAKATGAGAGAGAGEGEGEGEGEGAAAGNTMKQGVAYADHWSGPYRRLTPDAPLALPGDCEDPGIYRDPKRGGIFRMVLHCGCAYQLMWSADGVRWIKHGAEQKRGWCSGFNYTDGSAGELKTRQRPKWVTDASGAATHLTTGVNRPGDKGMGHTWTMANVLLNMTATATTGDGL